MSETIIIIRCTEDHLCSKRKGRMSAPYDFHLWPDTKRGLEGLGWSLLPDEAPRMSASGKKYRARAVCPAHTARAARDEKRREARMHDFQQRVDDLSLDDGLALVLAGVSVEDTEFSRAIYHGKQHVVTATRDTVADILAAEFGDGGKRRQPWAQPIGRLGGYLLPPQIRDVLKEAVQDERIWQSGAAFVLDGVVLPRYDGRDPDDAWDHPCGLLEAYRLGREVRRQQLHPGEARP